MARVVGLVIVLGSLGMARGADAGGPASKGDAAKVASSPGVLATYEFRSIKASNGYDANAVRAAFEGRNSLQDCYANALAKAPKLKGLTTAKLTIGADGKVSSATAKGFTAAVDPCVAKALRQLVFAKPEDGKAVDVELMIDFHPLTQADIDRTLDTLSAAPAGQGGAVFGAGGTGTMPGSSKTSTTNRDAAYGIGPAPRTPPLRLSVGDVAVTGSMDKEVIARVLRARFGQFRACAQRAALRNPAARITGTLTASFTIQANGATADVSTSGLDPDVATCVATSLKVIRFPSPKDGDAKVKAPIVFSAAAADEPATAPAPKP